jgi:phosphatidylglycerol---prolipoprotein diacylglyceryl transferase
VPREWFLLSSRGPGDYFRLVLTLLTGLIPYFRPPKIDLGIVDIESFGIMTAVGVLTAALLIQKAAKKNGVDPDPLQDMVLWALAGGVIGGHLTHVLLYHPEELRRSWLQLFKVWDGLSSMGGLVGGIAATLIYFRRKKISPSVYSDSISMGMAPGWGIARLGCFLVHDHPGHPTDFFLAVDFPPSVYPGGPRHDLGLDDALVLFTLSALLWFLNSRGLMKGRLTAVLAVGYGICRFFLDFLRATDLSYIDKRYFGLTPAQYVVFALVVWGVYRLLKPTAPAPPVTPPKSAKGQKRRAAA